VNTLKYIKNVIKGIVIGVSMMIPGVSGGTMAIVLGIYDKLVHSVAAFFKDWKKNFIFLLQVAIGGGIGVLIFSRLMEGAMTSYPHIMRFLIMGIIIGGLPLLLKKAAQEGRTVSSNSGRLNDSKGILRSGNDVQAAGNDMQTAGGNGTSAGKSAGRSWWEYVFLLLGAAIVLLMSMEPESLIQSTADGSLLSYILLLVAGFIIAIGLVLPGISWSFMLLVLGMYEITLNAINTLNIPFLIPLGIGLALGTFGTAKVIERFLQRHPRKTYMLIIGFVAGSLVEVFPGIPTGWQLPVSVAALIIGFIAMFMLGKKGLAD
jgi:putative membrane protein